MTVDQVLCISMVMAEALWDGRANSPGINIYSYEKKSITFSRMAMPTLVNLLTSVQLVSLGNSAKLGAQLYFTGKLNIRTTEVI